MRRTTSTHALAGHARRWPTGAWLRTNSARRRETRPSVLSTNVRFEDRRNWRSGGCSQLLQVLVVQRGSFDASDWWQGCVGNNAG